MTGKMTQFVLELYFPLCSASVASGCTHITYLLESGCGLQYVGRTTRRLRIRLREHINNIKKGFRQHSLSNYFRIHHNKNPASLKFFGIDKIEKHWWGTNLRTAVSQNETKWIYQLGTMTPKGLNVELDINCFISNY